MGDSKALSTEVAGGVSQKVSRMQGNFQKHIATIYVAGTLSPLERKLWNVMTKNAVYEFGTNDEHTIPLSVLAEAAGYNSKDLKPLKEAFKKLFSTPIEWIQQVKGKDEEFETNEEWAGFSFLSQVKVRNGQVTYSYAPFLRENLADPAIYAQINLDVQKSLSKGKALALYEIVARFRPNPNKGFKGLTEVFSVAMFKEMMGVTDVATFRDGKRIGERLIKPNVKKINAHTDIKIEPIIHKTGTTITGIQFKVEDNPQLPLFAPEEISTNPVYEKLRHYGICHAQAELFFEKNDEKFLADQIKGFERKLENGEIKKSPKGYLVTAINQKWDLSDSKQILKDAQDKKKFEAEKKAAAKEAEKRQKEEAQKAKDAAAAKELENQVNQILERMKDEDRKALEQKFGELMAKDNVVGASYKKGGLNHIFVKGFWHDFVVQNG